jgi:SagB-type dehydrogenase family enzyme
MTNFRNNLNEATMKNLFFIILFTMSNLMLFSQQNISLPQPKKVGGMPLMEALATRSTSRSFQSQELSNQQLSDLLWAAFGINRPDGKRTAPSSRNIQETDLYVFLNTGVYTYDAPNNQLVQVSNDDIRFMAGKQDFVKDAPVQIVLVADLSKMGDGSSEEKLNTANIDAGYISQNIYLFCTSEGLATGARAFVDKEALSSKLKLRPDQKIIIAHSVGYLK